MTRPNSSFRAQSSIPGAIDGENGDADSVGDMEGNGTRLTETDIGAVENEGGGAEGEGSEGKSWKAKLCCCCPCLS